MTSCPVASTPATRWRSVARPWPPRDDPGRWHRPWGSPGSPSRCPKDFYFKMTQVLQNWVPKEFQIEKICLFFSIKPSGCQKKPLFVDEPSPERVYFEPSPWGSSGDPQTSAEILQISECFVRLILSSKAHGGLGGKGLVDFVDVNILHLQPSLVTKIISGTL